MKYERDIEGRIGKRWVKLWRETLRGGDMTDWNGV